MVKISRDKKTDHVDIDAEDFNGIEIEKPDRYVGLYGYVTLFFKNVNIAMSMEDFGLLTDAMKTHVHHAESIERMDREQEEIWEEEHPKEWKKMYPEKYKEMKK